MATIRLNAAPVECIYVNGKTAERYYRKYAEPVTGRAAVCLPSTSPANAAWSLDALAAVWRGSGVGKESAEES